MKINLIVLILSLSLFGCSTIYFSPVSWFESTSDEVETSATIYGDCTTDGQCEELVPRHNLFCYKERSYVGRCVQIVQ